MIRLAVSPVPIGLTPGFLSNAMSLQDRKGAMLTGSTNSVQSLCAVSARELHSSREAALKEVQSLLQLSASRPDGPAAPLVCRTADLMAEAFKHSKGRDVRLEGHR